MDLSNNRTTKLIEDVEAIRRLAAELPQWNCVDAHLRRLYKTGGWKATLMVVNTIGHLSEAAWHHPELLVSYDTVEIRLTTHDAGGLTAKDFDLASKIEEVVTWQPGSEPSSALEGTPDEPRFKYISYE